MAQIINNFSVRGEKHYKQRVESDQSTFKSLYRFEEENVNFLAEHFLGVKAENRGGALSNVTKMKIFLRCIGDPGFQTGVGEDVGVHQTTVSKTFHEVNYKILIKFSLQLNMCIRIL